MLRGADRRFLPNTWSNIGGGMERGEMDDPQATCLREIEEETGITAGEIRTTTPVLWTTPPKRGMF